MLHVKRAPSPNQHRCRWRLRAMKFPKSKPPKTRLFESSPNFGLYMPDLPFGTPPWSRCAPRHGPSTGSKRPHGPGHIRTRKKLAKPCVRAEGNFFHVMELLVVMWVHVEGGSKSGGAVTPTTSQLS
jgi:hypothetical protein